MSQGSIPKNLYIARVVGCILSEVMITSIPPTRRTAVFPTLTVLENARLGYHRNQKGTLLDALLHTRTWALDEESATRKAYEELEFFGLMDSAEKRALNLAYGQLRLLEIAIALSLEPELLLLDEPAAGMNPEETESLMELIKRIRDRDITILLVEHNMRLVMGISDRILAMDHGRELVCGPPAMVSNDERVIEAYLGGYFRNDKGMITGEGFYDHIMDATGYSFYNMLPLPKQMQEVENELSPRSGANRVKSLMKTYKSLVGRGRRVAVGQR